MSASEALRLGQWAEPELRLEALHFCFDLNTLQRKHARVFGSALPLQQDGLTYSSPEPFLNHRMTARRVSIRQKAAALDAADAQRRFQAETLGDAVQPAESPNQDRFVQQLTGRVRLSHHPMQGQHMQMLSRACNVSACAGKSGESAYR